MYIYLALSIFTTLYAVCSDTNSKLQGQLKTMMEENETISPDDSCTKRCTRNFKRFVTKPLEFCSLGLESNDPEQLRLSLLNYIMQQKLTYQGEPLCNHPDGYTLSNMFEEKQKSEIGFYILKRKSATMSEECGVACCCCVTAACSLPQETICLPAIIASLLCYASAQQ